MEPKARRLYEALFFNFEWADLVNCTPHTISIWAEVEPERFEEIFSIEPCGITPRVSVIETEHPECHRFPFPIYKNELGETEGLPENDTGDRIFIVSRMVLDASDRSDLIAPDTGKTAIRNEKGHILGVTQFVKK